MRLELLRFQATDRQQRNRKQTGTKGNSGERALCRKCLQSRANSQNPWWSASSRKLSQRSHNPKVAGSNPAPATQKYRQPGTSVPGWCRFGGVRKRCMMRCTHLRIGGYPPWSTLPRHGLIEPSTRKRGKSDYKRWERSRPMELSQMDVVGSVRCVGQVDAGPEEILTDVRWNRVSSRAAPTGVGPSRYRLWVGTCSSPSTARSSRPIRSAMTTCSTTRSGVMRSAAASLASA